MYPTGERRGSRNNRRPSSIAMGMPETRLLLSTCVEGGQGPNASTRCISSRVSIWAGLVCVQAWPEARFTTSINARHKFIMAPLASQNSMSCSTTLDPVIGADAEFSSRTHQSRARTVVTGAEIVHAATCITSRKHARHAGNHFVGAEGAALIGAAALRSAPIDMGSCIVGALPDPPRFHCHCQCSTI